MSCDQVVVVLWCYNRTFRYETAEHDVPEYETLPTGIEAMFNILKRLIQSLILILPEKMMKLDSGLPDCVIIEKRKIYLILKRN